MEPGQFLRGFACRLSLPPTSTSGQGTAIHIYSSTLVSTGGKLRCTVERRATA